MSIKLNCDCKGTSSNQNFIKYDSGVVFACNINRYSNLYIKKTSSDNKAFKIFFLVGYSKNDVLSQKT